MYMKGQKRVSMVPKKNTFFRQEVAGMHSFGSNVTEKERTNVDDW